MYISSLANKIVVVVVIVIAVFKILFNFKVFK